MLVLSRKNEEAIVFPSLNIRIVVCEIRGDKVRLGIECDKGISILREELWIAKQAVSAEQLPVESL